MPNKLPLAALTLATITTATPAVATAGPSGSAAPSPSPPATAGAAPTAAPAATADHRSPVMAALFHIAGESFTPPAENRALQDLLAQHPALSFLEACGVGDTAEIQRQLARD